MSEQSSNTGSYFDLDQSDKHSTSHSEPVSPLSGSPNLQHLIRARQLRPRLDETTRSSSENSVFRTRLQVQTIDEEIQSDHSTPSQSMQFRSPHLQIRLPSSATQRTPRSTYASLSTSSSTTSRSDRELYSEGTSRSRVGVKSESSVSRNFTRNRNDSSAFDAKGSARATKSSRPSIQPLRPPSIMSNQFIEQLEHQVKVEKTFTESYPQDATAPCPETVSRRSSSINARQIFSASVETLRRIRKSRNSKELKTDLASEDKFQSKFPSAQDHFTSLRRQPTPNNLTRVASLLQDVRGLNVSGRPTIPKRSSSGSRNLDSVGDFMLPELLARPDRAKSKELTTIDTASETSSLADLRMGLTPKNTPEDQATYSVVDRDGNREDFFKIDISIRGQTSYLPSEARRIHTPPPPSEGRDGRKRGFFFDYNVPQLSAPISAPTSTSAAINAWPPKVPRSATCNQSGTSPVPTISKGQGSNGFCHNAKLAARDWYDVQLSGLDISSDQKESDPTSSQAWTGSLCKMPAHITSNDSIFSNQYLDHSIPEHLQTSPLCPRHPRYWRIVKQKGSQFRGCWMHGFGEYSRDEKDRYGIEDKRRL